MGKLMAFAVVALGLGLTAAAGNTVRAAWFREDISCEIGEKIAGYGPNDVSVGKLDDLEACGLCIDDGERKLLIVALDLLGMDADILDWVRHACAGESRPSRTQGEMMLKKNCLLISFVLFLGTGLRAADFSVVDYGARADGVFGTADVGFDYRVNVPSGGTVVLTSGSRTEERKK